MAFTKWDKIKQNLHLIPVDIEDTSYNSDDYFRIIDLKNEVTLGTTVFALRGSDNLLENSEIDFELLDYFGQVIPLNAFNEKWAGEFSSVVIKFEVTSNIPNGDAQLTIVGKTAKGKTIRWKRTLTVIKEHAIDEDFGSYRSPRNVVPLEVSGLSGYISASDSWTSSPYTSSNVNIRLKWLNHYLYPENILLTESQGGTIGSPSSSDPTFSILDKDTRDSIDRYYVFLYDPDNNSEEPPGDPDYYPGLSDGGSQTGKWYWVDTIISKKGTGSLSNEYVEYVIRNLPASQHYYVYVAMSSEETLKNWNPNLWENIARGQPDKV